MNHSTSVAPSAAFTEKQVEADGFTIREEMNMYLDLLASVLESNPDYVVRIEGHTDDVPIATSQFPSNWELSAHRASAVVRFLISRGVEADRMIAVGMADTQPKVPHRDDAGNPIVENRDINRRIVIKIER